MFRHYEDKMLRGYEDKKPFVLIASGPSLTQEQVNQCRGRATVIAINDNYLMAPWADYLYFCDGKWYQWHKDKPEFKNFKGKIITQDEKAAKEGGFEYMPSRPEEGLSTEPGFIHQGSNSGYQAINLAYHLGGRRILLIGYDVQFTGGKAHWFGEHPDKVRSSYKSWFRHYDKIAKDAEKSDLEIINCTLDTALTCFPRRNLGLALAENKADNRIG
jgi:hypothetical protein